MSETRMAGDASRERRERARERIAASPERTAKRLSGIDRDAYDFDGYSDKDIVMAMQGGSFTDKDYSRLTGKPFDDGSEETKPEPEPEDTTPVEENPVKPLPVEEEDDGPGDFPFPVAPGPGKPGGQTQQVYQDNDINQTIGSNSNVINNVDNSVSQQSGGYSQANRFRSDWMKEYDFFK